MNLWIDPFEQLQESACWEMCEDVLKKWLKLKKGGADISATFPPRPMPVGNVSTFFCRGHRSILVAQSCKKTSSALASVKPNCCLRRRWITNVHYTCNIQSWNLSICLFILRLGKTLRNSDSLQPEFFDWTRCPNWSAPNCRITYYEVLREWRWEGVVLLLIATIWCRWWLKVTTWVD